MHSIWANPAQGVEPLIFRRVPAPKGWRYSAEGAGIPRQTTTDWAERTPPSGLASDFVVQQRHHDRVSLLDANFTQ